MLVKKKRCNKRRFLFKIFLDEPVACFCNIAKNIARARGLIKEMKIASQHCCVLHVGRGDVDKEEAIKQFYFHNCGIFQTSSNK
ncbi:hypothetical protein A7K69_12470 [Parageobacillus thermoglucosidasius]|uniref:Uncharacterized protein n=1 Tax=Parageobacillus thermoglucosidasius TaxID=1426 RepID=A0A1B7KNG4_PARTM|nr:hypothetical protein A7K69_12470 [Parageobacillus thermoglucosidasius]